MIEIITDRLLIIPCSLDIAKSLIFHRKELEKRSPIEIPETWPSPFVKGVLPLYIEKLEVDESEYGWGLWLIILYDEKRIIGDLFMQGKPTKEGMVELRYHVHDKHLNSSIAYEAVDAFIEWLVIQKKVVKIKMECNEQNEYSIKLYEKLGMICTKKEGSFLMWELQKKE